VLLGNFEQKGCRRPAAEHLCTGSAQARPRSEETGNQNEDVEQWQRVAGAKHSASPSHQTCMGDAQRHSAQL